MRQTVLNPNHLTHLEGLLIFCQICEGGEEPTVPDLPLVDVKPIHALEKILVKINIRKE
jgi:hypothetical protein